MEERFMLLKELREEGKAEGIAESIIEILEDIGSPSEELRDAVYDELDITTLKRWLKLALKVESIEQFANEM